MATVTELQNQLSGIEGELGNYGSGLNSEIKQQIQDAYTPGLQRSLNVTRDQMGDYLGNYFDATTQGPGMTGTDAKDLSPMQKLGVMGRNLGTMTGNLNATSRFSDYLGGQMTDMTNNAVNAAALGQQGLESKYNRTFGLLQMEEQKAAAARAAAAQAAQAQQALDLQNYLSEQNNQGPNKENIISMAMNAARNIASQRGTGATSYVVNGENFGNINSAYNQIFDSAKEYGVNLNPEWLWAQLGNTQKPITGIGGKQMPGAYYTPTIN